MSEPQAGKPQADEPGKAERQTSETQTGEPQASETQTGEPRGSGLRNPEAAVRGVGAATLVLEAVVLLLAIAPIVKLTHHRTGLAIGAILVLVVACLALAGLMRRRWAWYAAVALQAVLALCGVFHLALLALGILFGAVWGYMLSVRRSVLGKI